MSLPLVARRTYALALVFVLATLAHAQSTSRIIDRSSGEEDQIRRRVEWFFSTRRAGVGSVDDLPALRRAAVTETSARIRAQRFSRLGGDSPNFWTELGPSPSHFGGWAFGDVAGRVMAIAKDAGSGAVYVASASGGLWKSTNDGATWTSLFDTAGTMPVAAIAVDPNNGSVLWAGTGDNVVGCESYFGVGLLRSVDGGITWEARNGSGGTSLEDLSSFANVVVDPRDSNHLVVGGRIKGCTSGSSTTGGIYTTADAGATWTKPLADTAVYEIQQDPTVLDTYWAATNKGVYKSVNNGVTWTVQTSSSLPSGSTGRTELAISPSSNQTVYVLFQSPSEVWRTTNGGSSWTKMSTGGNACDGQCSYNMVLRVHPTNPDIVYRGTVHVFKSVNGGANWTDLSNSWGSSQKVHQDTHALMTEAGSPETLWVGSDGGLWKSQDGGATFANKIGNMNLTQFYAINIHPTDDGIVCGGAQDNSSLARGGPTNVWDLQEATGDGFVCAINPVDPNYAYITSYPSGGLPSIYRSTSGVFGSFGFITGGGSGIISGDRIDWVTPYVLDPVTPSVLYLGTHRVYKSINHGTSWTLSSGDLTGGSGDILALEVNRNFPGTVLAGTTDGRVSRSQDAGGSWIDITSGLPPRSINDVAADPTDPGRAFAVVGGFGTAHLFEHTGTGTWIARGAGLPNVPANSVLMLTADDIVVGTDVGVFRSTDGGANFAPYMNGLPEGLVVTDLKFNPTTSALTAGTYGRGAWQVVVDPIEPILIFDSVSLPMTAVDGDGDTHVEPGETWSFTPSLRNVGGQSALAVTGRVSSATPGVALAAPAVRSFGDVAAGATSAAASPVTFTVDPGFACGSTIVFDMVEIASSNAPSVYPDRPGAFSVTVVDLFEPDIVTGLLDEDFDPSPPSGWTHEMVNPGLGGCSGQTYRDEWKIATKDAGHAQSFHLGNGPGAVYAATNYAWLYYGGKDSGGGPGIVIPAEASSALLTVTHWYASVAGRDGGMVAADVTDDGVDAYTPLVPDGGYPSSLAAGLCNGLEGNPAFSGSSGGWITSTFDLSNYVGRRIHLAFVFGSDRLAATGEGWYVDQVKVESRAPGPAICQLTRWPGSVPDGVAFDRLGSEIVASWSASCNLVEVPDQTYSIQAGDLAGLHASGTYSHAPIADACARVSPATFTPGAGDEYYLVVPNSSSAREGGAGLASAGARPQASAVCGARHEESCP